MRVLVVGSGRLGSELAYRLSRQGHEVTVLDQSAAAFDNLHSDYRGRTVQGDVLAEGVLQRAGADKADALAAVTNSDPINAVVARVARKVFGVRNVVVRSYAPSWIPMHEAFGSQVVSSTTWGAQRIEQLLTHGAARGVLSAGHGEVEVYELSVPGAWSGRAISTLVGEGALAVALTRGGKASLPGPALLLEDGDVLHVSATPEGIDALRRKLAEGSAPCSS